MPSKPRPAPPTADRRRTVKQPVPLELNRLPSEMKMYLHKIEAGDMPLDPDPETVDGHLDYNSHHPSTVITGTNPIYGPYTIKCDEGVADLIRQLNDEGYLTEWSCQGDPKGNGNTDAGYLVVRMPIPARLNRLNEIVVGFWNDRYLAVDIPMGLEHPQIIYRAFWKLCTDMRHAFLNVPKRVQSLHLTMERKFLEHMKAVRDAKKAAKKKGGKHAT